MHDHAPPPSRAVLVGVQLDAVSDGEFRESLAELGRLAQTLGYTVAGQVTQRRASFDRAAYLGPGKLDELKPVVASAGEGGAAVTVMVDHEITPSQSRNLEKATEATVLDRTAVILEIFHRHAKSRQAKAQVELVRLQYMAPRMREEARLNKGDRARGGIGGKGAGESGLELDRRKIRDRIAELRAEIDRIGDEHENQRARRRDMPRVALCGYTNAGKSTLMRALTGSDVLVADRLFATLDTTVRALHPPSHPPVLISDTVGFIRNLPHGLVASFKSTLDEALEASLILQVVDASDPAHPRQMAATDEVLDEIGAHEVPRRLILNKVDRLDEAGRERVRDAYPDALFVSAKSEADVGRVRAAILEFFRGRSIEAEVMVPHARQSLRAELYARCEVLGETSDEHGTTFRARATPEEIDRLRRLAAE